MSASLTPQSENEEGFENCSYKYESGQNVASSPENSTVANRPAVMNTPSRTHQTEKRKERSFINAEKIVDNKELRMRAIMEKKDLIAHTALHCETPEDK